MQKKQATQETDGWIPRGSEPIEYAKDTNGNKSSYNNAHHEIACDPCLSQVVVAACRLY